MMHVFRLLHQAALWDNAELLEDLLNGEELGYINSADSWGRTPAHAAATTESSQCLNILVQAGADVNLACGPRGECRTPLHVAAEHGHVLNLQVPTIYFFIERKYVVVIGIFLYLNRI